MRMVILFLCGLFFYGSHLVSKFNRRQEKKFYEKNLTGKNVLISFIFKRFLKGYDIIIIMSRRQRGYP